MDQDATFDTLKGTFTAFVYGKIRHVVADPSGFNWRLDGDDVAYTLQSFTERRNWVSTGMRQRVEINHLSDRTQIVAIDTALHGVYTETVLSLKGCEQFVAILQDAMQYPEGVKDWMQPLHQNDGSRKRHVDDGSGDPQWVQKVHAEQRRDFRTSKPRRE